jgi:hypothetical protein
MPCEVKKNTIWCSFGGVEKVENFIETTPKQTEEYCDQKESWNTII